MRNDVRALREAHGWSQGVLAEHLGVSRQSVNAIETGRYDPSLPLAFTIAALFDRSIEEVFFPGPEHGADGSERRAARPRGDSRRPA